MAATRSRENLALIERLAREPYRFDFFQAVRILERAASGANGDTSPDVVEDRHAARRPVGYDAAPLSEAVRFRASPTLGFPSCAVMDVRPSPAASNGNGGGSNDGGTGTLNGATDMVVSFMGLTGPNGVLPLHYTRLLIERIREKDYSLRDFFDLFNHRLISLFYRAWEKYRFPAGYARAHEAAPDARDGKQRVDLFTSALFSLVGMGTREIRGRQTVADEAFLFYGGYFADAHRSATALERMVGDYFNLPASTEQFQGQWLNLESADRSRLADAEYPLGLNNQLGMTAVLGDRVWDVQSRFRMKLGPLTYAQYCRFMPCGDGLRPICELIRTFVGPEFDFDVQPVLKASEVPMTRLSAAEAGAGAGGVEVKPRMGWNVWLKSQEMKSDFSDAAFFVSE